MTYRIRWTARARRQLENGLPPSVAPAVMEFVYGPLAENPHRVGRRLRAPLDDTYAARRGEYRITYRIDDGEIVVIVVSLLHRRDAYRSTS